MESIYLDHAAATPVEPEVVAAMEAVRESGFGNPSSPHAAGRRARRILEEARERILAHVGRDLGPGAGLVFTSGATEANRLGVLGMAADRTGRILSSARDHSSLRAAARELAARGWSAVTVPLEPDGTLARGFLASGKPGDGAPEILCATLACGQSGVWEDPAGLAAWTAAAADRLVHVDATQALFGFGTAPFGLPADTAATLAIAPHKFGGPRGIGGLVVRRTTHIAAIAPGTQEAGLRGGTEAVMLAVGFAAAVEAAVAKRDQATRHMATLRDSLESRLVAVARATGIPAQIVARHARRAPHIATIVLPGIDRQAFVMAADLEGVCCATGTACTSGSSEPSALLLAMGLPPVLVSAAVRFSVGLRTTMDEIDGAIERLALVCSRIASRVDAATRDTGAGPGSP